MADNVTLPGTGAVVETLDKGAGVERQVVTISPRDLTTGDSIGALTETAPATDTASSGLNGRLQRIAQRITSLIALLPTALGAGGGLKVDGSGTALPTSMADGGAVTLGAKADAKSTATDTTAVSAMSVFKQISFSMQALATVFAAGLNINGPALAANGAPVTHTSTSFRVAVVATVTASAYTAGNVLGGVLTFANMLLGAPQASPTKWSAVLESISVKFKATVVTGEIDVAVFTASPGGTYTDKTAPTFTGADAAKLVGIYQLTVPLSALGTMTCYNLDGIGAAIDGASTSLFAVVIVKGTPTPASTSDVSVELGVLQG